MMNPTVYRWIERVVIGCMVASIIGMFQPFSIAIYGAAFPLLLVATLVFIVLSHIPQSES
jgi:hypothetical protein